MATVKTATIQKKALVQQQKKAAIGEGTEPKAPNVDFSYPVMFRCLRVRMYVDGMHN